MPPNETLGQGLKIEELCQDDITNTLVFFVNGEFENMFPCFLNINSDHICRPVVPGVPDFGRSVNPIPSKGDRLCPPNHTGTPGFSYLPTAL